MRILERAHDRKRTSAFSVSSSASSTVCSYCASAPDAAASVAAMRARTRPTSRNDQSTPSATRRVSLSRSNSALAVGRLRADEPAEREPREQVGRRDADARRRRVQPLLGRGDVGPTAQQLARRAGIDRDRERGQRSGRIERCDQCTGWLTGQHRKAMHRDVDRGRKRGDAGQRRFEL
jgi:hypothetical protein